MKKHAFSAEKVMRLRSFICGAALLGLLATASPALGSTAKLTKYGVEYTASPREANDVRITSSNQLLGGGPIAIEIADAGATIDPVWPRFHWWGCEPLGDGVKRSSRGFWTRWFPCRPSGLVSLTRSGNEQLRRRQAQAPS